MQQLDPNDAIQMGAIAIWTFVNEMAKYDAAYDDDVGTEVAQIDASKTGLITEMPNRGGITRSLPTNDGDHLRLLGRVEHPHQFGGWTCKVGFSVPEGQTEVAKQKGVIIA